MLRVEIEQLRQQQAGQLEQLTEQLKQLTSLHASTQLRATQVLHKVTVIFLVDS